MHILLNQNMHIIWKWGNAKICYMVVGGGLFLLYFEVG